jgi:isochorismate synthase
MGVSEQDMFVTATDIDQARLLDLVTTGIARARRLGRSILVSHTERVATSDLLPCFLAGRLLGESVFFWEQVTEALAIAGIGSAYAISVGGADRFDQTARLWQDLLEQAVIDGLDTLPGSGPTLVGGFAFEPSGAATVEWHGFGAGDLHLPRLQLTTSRGATALTCNVVVDQGQEPQQIVDDISDWVSQNRDLAGTLPTGCPRHDALEIHEDLDPRMWKRLVEDATVAIRGGSFEKVVLARAVRLQARQLFDVGGVIDSLRSAYPNAYVFAVQRGNRCFLGATPERLVGVRSGLVRASGLAGTTRRGATPAEDRELGDRLLASSKDRHEHAVVVEMLREAVEDLCVDVHIPATPQVWKLANVQHLYTPVTGRLRSPYTLLDLVARLHPTPAVGGLPREAALRYIQEHERLDRGWYAAPVGWLDARGEGDFAVALRSGLVHGSEATLFAGCGIVADSEPEAELAETWLKMRPMMSALGGEER